MRMRYGVIDVGGGFRGIYAAGVLDRCLEDGIRFDVGIGVSAGSANMASYAAGQRGRNHRFYTDYAMRPSYLGVGNIFRKHEALDLDYVYSVLSNADGEDPLDYAALRDNPIDLCVVATDAQTGLPRYFGKRDLAQDDYDILKASSALPVACRPYPIGGRSYFDGALGDCIPLDRAFGMGCDKVVLILTKPESVRRTPERDSRVASLIRHRYPAAAERLRQRAEHYNAGVDRAQELARQGRVLIVAPDDTCGVDTLTRKRDALERLYRKGLEDGGRIAPFMRDDREVRR